MVLGAEELRAALRIGRALDIDDDDDELFSLARRHRDDVNEKLRGPARSPAQARATSNGFKDSLSPGDMADLEVPYPYARCRVLKQIASLLAERIVPSPGRSRADGSATTARRTKGT
jgi:hypothetical protein